MPLQVLPLEMTEVGLGWQNGWVTQSDNLICGGCGGVMRVLLMDYCFITEHHFDEW